MAAGIPCGHHCGICDNSKCRYTTFAEHVSELKPETKRDYNRQLTLEENISSYKYIWKESNFA